MEKASASLHSIQEDRQSRAFPNPVESLTLVHCLRKANVFSLSDIQQADPVISCNKENVTVKHLLCRISEFHFLHRVLTWDNCLYAQKNKRGT